MVSYLATATLAVSLLGAAPDAPQWEADYGKALVATRADDRPLLVVIEISQTSDAAIEQVSHTKDTKVLNETELLAPYHLCRVDASTEYGKRVAEAFGVTSFPYTAIIDKSGSVVIYAKNGTHSAGEWADTLLTHKEGDRTEALVMASASNTSTVMFRKSSDSNSSPYCASCQRGYCPTCQ